MTFQSFFGKTVLVFMWDHRCLCFFSFCSVNVLIEIYLTSRREKTNKQTKPSRVLIDYFCAEVLIQHLARLTLSLEIIQSWKFWVFSGLYWAYIVPWDAHSSCPGHLHSILYFPAYTDDLDCPNSSKKISLAFLPGRRWLFYVSTVIFCPRQLHLLAL